MATAFQLAAEQYAALDVDVEQSIARLAEQSISIQCWQGDDVSGFEQRGTELGGGLAVTGKYPGRARNADELRADAEVALSQLPGRHRFNLHASYAESGPGRSGPTCSERNQLETGHFGNWIAWAKSLGIGLDFNPTFFAHPLAASGMTLAHADQGIRRFWIEHGQATRRIAAHFGAELGTAAVHNLWIPDGMKDLPVDRWGPRARLRDSLDQIFAESFSESKLIDSVEGKLFGIGSESYVVGSHEFYLGYATRRQIAVCLDSGHYHPTEELAEKLSAVLQFVPRVLLHVSRGVRWDSDHVVILNDELRAIATELVRGDCLERVRIGLDYFDASINRIAAWVLGVRATQQAFLQALLEPEKLLRSLEEAGDFTGRLVLMEQAKQLPWGAVWTEFCERANVAPGGEWLQTVRNYENNVLSLRR
ncbi:MAG: L-rhamnose isomerase [Planctomycetota bacterium]